MTSSRTPLWADNPTPEDLLGFSDIAEPIIDALGREHLDPVAIGVFGDWGSGKTTVLELIQKRLEEATDVVVVYTRPWEYDPATDPKATLIGEVLDAIRREVADEQGSLDALGETVVDSFKRLAKRIRWSKAITLAGKTAVGLALPSFDDLVGIFREEGSDDQPPAEPTLHGFREEFDELMAELAQIRRVVVLVDDLDRCLPPTVVDALEAVKLFLSVRKMGFVIAADRRLVALSIAERYRPAAQADAMARQYLEKIVQIPLTVPALGRGDTEAYLALLLLQRHLPDAADRVAAVVAHCDAQRAKSVARTLDDLPAEHVPDGAGTDLALAAQVSPVLYERTQGNPRRLKRFLNAFWLRADIATRRGVELEAGALAKLLVLEEHEPEQFVSLLEWLNRGELTARLSALEDPDAAVGTPDPHAVLRAWARQAPALAALNLEPYLRLAASLAAKPTAGTALRSDLQAVVEGLLDSSAGKRKAAISNATALQTEDRLAIAKELISVARADPDRQSDIAESLARLSEDEAVGTDIATRLREFDGSEVRAPLIVRLTGANAMPAMRDTVAMWVESGQLDEMAAKVAAKALEKGGS
jgi:hypothetical protein